MMTNAGARIDVRASFRGGPIRWLVIGGLLLIAAIVIGTTIMAGNFRERALNSSKRDLENTVMLLAHHFDQQFHDFGVIQQDLVAFIQAAGIDSAEGFRRRMSSADVNLMLKAKMAAMSYVGGVNLFDSDGTLINSSNGWPPPLVNVADRAYFKAFKADPKNSPDTFLEPVHSRITGAWTTVIARKVTGPNGEFLGAIGRGFEPAIFEKFFASVTLGKDATVSMVHRDGTLLARFPHNEARVGKNLSDGPLIQRVLSEGGTISGTFIRPIDGEERLGAVSPLSGVPLVILSSTSVAAALADWRGQMRFLISVGAISVLVIPLCCCWWCAGYRWIIACRRSGSRWRNCAWTVRSTT
jgi:Cache domain